VLVKELAKGGGKSTILELGPNIGLGANTAAPIRFFRLLGCPVTDSNAMIGDVPIGGTITLGAPDTDGSSDDWFRSDYLVLWAFNPVISRIPDAHFMTEIRYRGGRSVVISPDYSPTAMRSDLWLSPRPGADGALALGACQVILSEGLFDEEYIREQTDLPFLVRTDTGRFLRESDLVEGGNDTRFGVWDETSNGVVWAPGTQGSDERTLKLGDTRPALEKTEKIRLPGGEKIGVETVLTRLRRRLDADYRPEQAARLCGVAPGAIRRFGREFARARAALIISNFGSAKNYHSDLMQRAQILLASLTGNLGRQGGGWRSNAFIGLEGFGLLCMREKLDLLSLAWAFLISKIQPEKGLKEFNEGYVASTLFHAIHGGLAEVAAAPEYGDPGLEEGPMPYLREAIERGHFPIGPGLDDPPPSVIVNCFGSILRHAPSYPRIRERLFDPARLIVDVNFRMNETGRYADLILPAAAWYEKVGLKYITMTIPYVTLGDRAVAPAGESKPEWEIFSRLAQRVAIQAREQGVTTIQTWRGEERDLSTFDEAFSAHGRFGPDDEEAALDFILSVSSASWGTSLEDLRKKGVVRLRALGPQGGTASIHSDYDENAPVVPFQDFTEKKHPYPTLTGRQQFYIDHPWFLKLGEELPVHKPSPAAGGDYPLVMTGGHTRWSIHAQWRDEKLLLRLQRGEPVLYLSLVDCRKRGIRDHDWVRVHNDLGSFVARAKPTDAIRPGSVHIYHAWEPFQFKGGVSHQALCPSPLKVTQLVGDYGHIHWGFGRYEPNQVPRDTRVGVERLEEATT
jgi:DMSO reductase family type II enzyme molybdopterin subunit